MAQLLEPYIALDFGDLADGPTRARGPLEVVVQGPRAEAVYELHGVEPATGRLVFRFRALRRDPLRRTDDEPTDDQRSADGP